MRRRRRSTSNTSPENPAEVRTLSTDAQSPDNKAAEEILKSGNAAAGTIRNLFISYILLAVYILITVGSTNDEQLLKDSGVAVPFLSNITLPVSYFYQFAPWLFGFFHFELLIHFKLLADKLHAFNHELEPLPASTQEDFRQRLASFPFSHWLAGERDDVPMQFVTGLVVWVTLFLLPLFTLLALQIGFLPYHSDGTTFFHRLAVLGDAAALGFFWPKLVESYPGNPLDWWRERLQAWPLAVKAGIWWLFVACFAWECWNWFFDGEYLRQLGVWIQLPFRESPKLPLNETRYGLILAPLALWWLFRAWQWAKRRPWTKLLGAVPLALLILSLAGMMIKALVTSPEILLQRWTAFYAELVFIVLWPTFVAGHAERSWFENIGVFPPFSWLARILHWLRRAPIHEETRATASTRLTAQRPFATPATAALFLAVYISVLLAALPDTGLEKGHPLTRILFENGLSLLHRNLHLPEKLLVANSPELETISVLEHSGSDDSQSIDAALVKVVGLDLRRRDLRYAELLDTKMYKADLRYAKIQGVRFSGARLHGTKLNNAILQKANLTRTQFQRADLSYAQLQGANFGDAILQGANLTGAQLQGADLSYAQLQGTELKRAQLQGANLTSAQLQGVDLRDIQLQGAYLGNTQLQGATLAGRFFGKWERADALLQGANFHEANIGSTIFNGLEFSLNDFRDADFSKPFSQDHFVVIAKILGDEQKTSERKEYLSILHQRIGQATLVPMSNLKPPCLINKYNSFVNNCGKAEKYFQQLAEFLGKLACESGDAKSQLFIAAGIAQRVINFHGAGNAKWDIEFEKLFTHPSSEPSGSGNARWDIELWDEWKNGGESSRQKLAQRLLTDDCTGKEGIDAETKVKLKEIIDGKKNAILPLF